jgi:hypothetical protein
LKFNPLQKIPGLEIYFGFQPNEGAAPGLTSLVNPWLLGGEPAVPVSLGMCGIVWLKLVFRTSLLHKKLLNK